MIVFLTTVFLSIQSIGTAMPVAHEIVLSNDNIDLTTSSTSRKAEEVHEVISLDDAPSAADSLEEEEGTGGEESDTATPEDEDLTESQKSGGEESEEITVKTSRKQTQRKVIHSYKFKLFLDF